MRYWIYPCWHCGEIMYSKADIQRAKCMHCRKSFAVYSKNFGIRIRILKQANGALEARREFLEIKEKYPRGMCYGCP